MVIIAVRNRPSDLEESIQYNASARVVKVLASLAYCILTTLRTLGQKLLGMEQPASCIVLCYHAVAGNERERFARQMDLLCRYAKPVRADVPTPLPAGKRYAAVTFDDAYQSVIHNALPELRSRNIPCALFVVADLLGEYPRWAGTNGFDPDDRFITSEQLRGLSTDLVLVGSHTMTHPSLPSLAQKAAQREVCESRKNLQSMLEREVRLFAFPHGAFNDFLIKCCHEAGYERVFSIERRMAFSDANEYVTGRTSTDPSDWDIEFRLKLLGAYSWIPAMLELKRRIFVRLAKSQSANYQVAG